MGREVGRWFRMGNTCKSMADACQRMAKPIQYCKVISLQLIKRKGKTKKEIFGGSPDSSLRTQGEIHIVVVVVVLM